MGGLSGLNKGKGGEREIKNTFITAMEAVEKDFPKGLGHSDEVKRNTMQSDTGGFDIVGIPLLAIEVKRQETLSLNTWWGQTVEQAERRNLMPVLIYRQNRKAWRVMTWSVLSNPAGVHTKWVRSELDLTDFLDWYKGLYRIYLEGYAP